MRFAPGALPVFPIPVADTLQRGSVKIRGDRTERLADTGKAAISGDDRLAVSASESGALSERDTNGLNDIHVRGPLR